MEHLSTELLDRYSRRRLDAGELLKLDDHIANCDGCRENLRQLKAKPGVLLSLRASLQPVDEPAAVHLKQELLEAYAGRRLAEVDRELAESHLEVCQQCAAQAQQLSVAALQQSSSANPSTPSSWLTRVVTFKTDSKPLPLIIRLAGAAMMIALLVIVAALLLRSQKGDGLKAVESPPAPPPSPSEPSVTQPTTPQSPVGSQFLLVLNDGDLTISRDQEGNFTGLDLLSPEDRPRVKAALETGKVQPPDILKELRGSSGSIMGAPEATAFVLVSPVGKVLASDRPTLRWRGPSGAISYQVTVTDPARGYKEVSTSPELQKTEWTVAQPLERGRIYSWQVTARLEAGEVKAPGVNTGEAKFKVLESGKASELEEAKTSYPGRHLLLGLRYAEAGLLEEAERELKALVASNPQSTIARSLLHSIRSKAP